MKAGSKYYPLFEHLHHCNQASVALTFIEIEALMGCSLPNSARIKKNWWSNRDSPSALQAIAWVSAGYQVESVDLIQKTVTFKTFQATYNIQRKDGKIYPDTLVCSGMISAELNGKPCPYAQNGRLPDPIPLDANDPGYSSDKGNPRDLYPSCAKQQLAHLGHWQGHGGQTFPEELLPLRLFKCRMWLWLFIPGLHDAEPTKLMT